MFRLGFDTERILGLFGLGVRRICLLCAALMFRSSACAVTYIVSFGLLLCFELFVRSLSLVILARLSPS